MLSDKEKKLVLDFVSTTISSDDLVDFCEEKNIDVGDAFLYVSLQGAPECCRMCKNAGSYPSMSPCICCSRNKEDLFEKSDAPCI